MFELCFFLCFCLKKIFLLIYLDLVILVYSFVFIKFSLCALDCALLAFHILFSFIGTSFVFLALFLSPSLNL